MNQRVLHNSFKKWCLYINKFQQVLNKKNDVILSYFFLPPVYLLEIHALSTFLFV